MNLIRFVELSCCTYEHTSSNTKKNKILNNIDQNLDAISIISFIHSQKRHQQALRHTGNTLGCSTSDRMDLSSRKHPQR